eukprot:scaffold98374_cov48-Phaeocystis_antarctica.AAC.1
MLSASERYYETHGEPLFSSRRSRCKSRAAPNHTRTARRRQRPTQPREASLSKGSGRASSTHTRERSLGRSAATEGATRPVSQCRQLGTFHCVDPRTWPTSPL